MEILQAYQTKNRSYIRNRSITPVGILVHSTGAVNRNLKRYVDSPERLGVNTNKNHWNKTSATKSMHGFIGYDKNQQIIVANTLPYDRACWGCGGGSKGSYNYDPHAYLQFEICQGSNTDKKYYWAAIAVAEEYCVYLCRLYGWTADKIISHKEAAKAGYASNHGDPQNWMRYFGDDMNKFRARVAKRLNGTETPTEAPVIKDEQKPVDNAGTATTGKNGGKTVMIELSVLKNQSKGNQVKTAQRLLKAFGYDCGTIDGIFGQKTKAATIAFQKKHGLVADGIIGQKTWNALLK